MVSLPNVIKMLHGMIVVSATSQELVAVSMILDYTLVGFSAWDVPHSYRRGTIATVSWDIYVQVTFLIDVITATIATTVY